MSYNRLNHFDEVVSELQLDNCTMNKLRKQFIQVDESFKNHFHGKGFFNYKYLVLKLLQLNGQDMGQPCGGKIKLQLRDEQWNTICTDLDWRFIPSC